MKLEMIKLTTCASCHTMEPKVKKIAEQNNIEFKTLLVGKDILDTPENRKAIPYFPWFYLHTDDGKKEAWGGTDERKLLSVIKRHAS